MGKRLFIPSVSGFFFEILMLKNDAEFIEFSVDTPLPIKNKYKSTIGLDRLATVVAPTQFFFPIIIF